MTRVARRQVRAMGNVASFVLVGGDEALLDTLAWRLARLDALWSRFREDSDVSRLNRAGGAWTAVDPETVLLAEACRAAHRATDGAFDPTLLPALVQLGYRASRVDPTAITTLPPDAASGWPLDAMSIDTDRVRIPRGATLDPGGIGKGLAADLLVQDALARGASGALVEVGGDLAASGRAPDGVAWRVTVEDPVRPPGQLGVLTLASGGVATSSRRRLRWRHGAREVNHIVDPGTRDTAVTDVVAATVVAATGTWAEAVATCALVWGRDRFVAALPQLEASALVVLDDGTVLRAGLDEAAA